MAQSATTKPRSPGVFAIFLTTSPKRAVIIVGGLVLAGFAEMVGYGTLLPALTVAVGNGDEPSSWLQRTINWALSWVGVPADSLGFLLLIVVSAIIAKNGLMTWAMNYVGYEVAEVATGLRLKLIDTLLNVRWSYYARQPVGRFANAVSNEAARASEAYACSAYLISHLLQAAIYIALALLMVSWQLGAVTLVLGGAITYALKPLVRMARKAGRRQTQYTHDLVMRLTDTLTGIKPLKAMARHVRFGALFASEARAVNTALRRQVFGKQAMRGSQEVLLWVTACGLLYVAATFWHMALQELIVMGALLFRAILMCNRSQQWYQMATLSESAFWGMRQTIAEAEGQRETFSGSRTPQFQRGCTLQSVTFGYDDKTVVRDVSLVIPAGQITALTGTSGAGKTTIADLLLGLHRPSSGEVLIDDVPLSELDLVRWRELVGYVPQEVILFHDSVLANVTLGDPELSADHARTALEAAGAWEFVSHMPEGLNSIVGERGTLLSGGQRQRIAVARALIHRPSLLILDEATSALDPATEAEICRNLKDLVARTGLTIVAISHQRAWVEAADRVYYLEQGQVREVPDAAE